MKSTWKERAFPILLSLQESVLGEREGGGECGTLNF